MEIPKSSYYYSKKQDIKEIVEQSKYKGLRKKIEKIIYKHPSYGYRRIKDALSKKDIVINHKPLKKLLKMWNLQRKRKVKIPNCSQLSKYIKELGAKANLVKKQNNNLPLRIIFTDFTEIQCSFSKIHIILFSDKISRKIIGWNVGFKKDAINAIKGYKRARRYLKRMKIDLTDVIIHQDQGATFTGYEYGGTLLNDGISLSFTERGFKDNSAMESCIGHFKEDYEYQIKEAKNLKEVEKIIQRSIKDWNKERIHSALKGRSPDEFLHSFFKS